MGRPIKFAISLAAVCLVAGAAFGEGPTRQSMVQNYCFGNVACRETGNKGLAESWPLQDLIHQMALSAYAAGVENGQLGIGSRQAIGILRAALAGAQKLTAAELALGQTRAEFSHADGAEALRRELGKIVKWCGGRATATRELRCYFRRMNSLTVAGPEG